MLTLKKETVPFLVDFDEDQERVMQNSSGKLFEERTKSLELFNKNGIPTIKNEEWIHTNLNVHLRESFSLLPVIDATKVDQYTKIAKEMLDEIYHAEQEQEYDVYYIVSVNGTWRPGISKLPHPDHLNVQSLLDAQDQEIFQEHFNQIIDLEKHALSALNTALFENGICIEVPKNTKVDKPFHILHIWDTAQPTWYHSRNLIKLNSSASFELIETHRSLSDTKSVVSSVTEVVVENNAHFYHYEVQSKQEGLIIVNALDASQKKDSNYLNYTFTLPGSEFVRNNLSIYLDDHHLETHMYGFYLTAGKQLVDNHSEVHHKFTYGESNQLYKGVLLDESKGVFNGKIYVYPQAQKTNAFQESANVLYSPNATVNAKPQLEIFADDVKCSHGATMGQMDAEALFYLKSRGIGEATAKKMMIRAFAYDVSQKVENPTLKVYIEKLIDEAMNHYIAN